MSDDKKKPIDDETTDTASTEPEHDQTENTGVQFSVVFDSDDDPMDVNDFAMVNTDGTPEGGLYDMLAAAEATNTADAANSNDANDVNAASADAEHAIDADKPDPSEAEAHALASANASAQVTEENARRVQETLNLAKTEQPDALSKHPTDSTAEPATTLASRIDRVLVGGGADDILLKTYPTFALNKVTLGGGKGKVNVLDDVNCSCYSGHTYTLLIENDPDAGLTADVKRHALMGVITGLVRPNAGTVMTKSANIGELEPVELRGHRLGIVPQRHAVRPELDAEHNVLYAMNASSRNFLKPKPVIARELLAKVGFDEATSGVAVGTLPEVQQRLVAIARAISTEAEVLILDEPTHGLDDNDTVTVLATLAKLAHTGDPKHCVIILTGSREIAETADYSTTI